MEYDNVEHIKLTSGVQSIWTKDGQTVGQRFWTWDKVLEDHPSF